MHGVGWLVAVGTLLLSIGHPWDRVEAEPGDNRSQVLDLGVVPQFEPRGLHAVWEPLLLAVGKRAGVTIKHIGSPNIPVFEEQVMAGMFDIVYLNPYHMVKAHRAQGYRPIVRDVSRSLYGIVVVRQDSHIQDLRELNGQVVALPAPNALGASLLVRAALDRIYDTAIIPWYVNSHTSVYLNVLLDRATAGGGVQKTLSQQPPEVRHSLRIIYRTPEVASHPIAVHPRLSPQLQAKILDAFMALSHTPQGSALLANIPIGTIGLATMQDYFPIEKMALENYEVKE